MKVSEIASVLKLKVFGNTDVLLDSIGTPLKNTETSLGWAKNSNSLEQFEHGAVICGFDVFNSIKQKKSVTYLVTNSNPRLTFSKCVNEFLGLKGVILENCVSEHKVRKDLYVGDNTFIGPNVTIGSGTTIYPNSVIHAGSRIGKNCVIKSFCSIASEGLGYDLDPETGEYVKFPQIGGVTMEDNVIIGPNSTIRRGALSDTVIGKGTKIGALVNVGHNCIIGENCILSCMIVTAGSSKIGNNVFIGVNSVIRNQIKVGNHVTLGQGSVVVRDVEDNETIVGNPGVTLEEYKKWSGIRQRLLAEMD